MYSILSSIFIFACVIGSAFTNDTRIVGGQKADPDQFPYQVSIQLVRFGYAYHFCGGTLIHADYVLTAAHCTSQPVDEVYVWAGHSNLQHSSGKRIRVKKYIVHQKYSENSNDYDIAILQLESKFSLNSNIKTIQLTDAVPKDGKDCIVSGWGTTAEGATADFYLRYTTVPIVNQEQCRKVYESQVSITSNMICAGYTQGGHDSCQGDSGGPLVLDDKIVGIVSFGIGCARPNIPGVYTSVYQFADWIKTNGSTTLIINNMHLTAMLIVSLYFTFLYKN